MSYARHAVTASYEADREVHGDHLLHAYDFTRDDVTVYIYS